MPQTRNILRPMSNRLVVIPIAEEDVTPGGIYIPETAQKVPQKGIVVAVGPGAVNDNGVLVPVDIKVDDHVLYAKYAGTEVKVDGQLVLILSENDILAVFDDIFEDVAPVALAVPAEAAPEVIASTEGAAQ